LALDKDAQALFRLLPAAPERRYLRRASATRSSVIHRQEVRLTRLLDRSLAEQSVIRTASASSKPPFVTTELVNLVATEKLRQHQDELPEGFLTAISS
jgi:hypothetical protein